MLYHDKSHNEGFWLIGKPAPSKQEKRELSGNIIWDRISYLWFSTIFVTFLTLMLVSFIPGNDSFAGFAILATLVEMFVGWLIMYKTPLHQNIVSKDNERRREFLAKHPEIVSLNGFVGVHLQVCLDNANLNLAKINNSEALELIDEYFSGINTPEIDRLIAEEDAAGIVGSYALRRAIYARAREFTGLVCEAIDTKANFDRQQQKIIADADQAEKTSREELLQVAFELRGERLRNWT